MTTRPVVTATMPQTPVVTVTLPMTPVIDVRYPPVRVTQGRDDRPASIVLPIRQPQGWQRGRKRMRIWSPPPRRVTP